MEVLDTIPSKSRPNIGVVVSKVSMSNQKEEVVMEFTSKGIFSKSVDGFGASNKHET